MTTMASSSLHHGQSALGAPVIAADAVLKPSDPVPKNMQQIRGIEFEQFTERDMTVKELVAGMANMGFQATAVAEAVRIINDLVS